EQLGRELDAALVAVGRERQALAEVGRDNREAIGLILHEGLAREQQLDVHAIEAELTGREVLIAEVDRAALDLEIKAALTGGELGLLLLTIVGVDDRRGRAFELLQGCEQVGEALAPAIDGVLAIRLTELPGASEILAIKRDKGLKIVPLQAPGHAIRRGPVEQSQARVDAILQERIVSGDHELVVAQSIDVGQRAQERPVLAL